MDDPVTEIEILQSVRNLAQIVAAYYGELRNNGFTEDQAMELAMLYQDSLVARADAPSED